MTDQNSTTRTSGSPPKSMTLESIRQIAEASERIIERLQVLAHNDAQVPIAPGKGYSISEVAKMLSRTPDGIRKAEKQGKLVPPPLKENGRRSPYSLEQINTMRTHWNCLPGRKQGDEPIRFSFQNFKGGVGKTTLVCHCAQYLAKAGYRVLLVGLR